jgi:hypothetical protein
MLYLKRRRCGRFSFSNGTPLTPFAGAIRSEPPQGSTYVFHEQDEVKFVGGARLELG